MRRCLAFAALALILAPTTEVAGQRQPTASGNGRGVANAIVGRVTTADGAPVPEIFVSLLRPSVSRLDQSSRISIVSAILAAKTNDRGEFRLENLPPGPYYPVAFPQNLPVAGRVQPSRVGHAVTYHPNLTRLAEAQPVVLSATSTVTANITLAPAQLYVVSGSIIAPLGQPWRGEQLGVSHADELFGLDSRSLSIQPDGRFAVPNLPNGSYCLQMRVGASPPARDAVPIVFVTRVTVEGRDISNLRVEQINMVTARGHLVGDASTRAALQASPLLVGASPSGPGCNPGPQRPGTVQNDLAFEFKTWPGRGIIRIQRQAPGDVTAVVRLNGVDVTKSGIDFRAGTDISGLEIEISAPATSR